MSVITDDGYIVKIRNEDCEFVGEDLVIKTNIEVVTNDDIFSESEEEEEIGIENTNGNLFESIIKSECAEFPVDENIVIKTEKEVVNNNQEEDIFEAFTNTYVIPPNYDGESDVNFLNILPIEPTEHISINEASPPKRRKPRRRDLSKNTPRDEEGNFLCTMCDYKSKQMGHLGSHIDSKHSGIEYSCDLCDFRTKWKNRLNSHKRSIHKEEGGFPCPHCSYLACEKYVLSQHIKQVHISKENPNEKSYSCQHCNYKAHQKSHITAHVEAIHQQITYVCDLCGFQTKWKNRLRTHTNAKHRGLKIYCDHCDFSTSEKFQLKQHISKKHGNIQFTCFVCDVQVPSRTELSSHMENVHQVQLL